MSNRWANNRDAGGGVAAINGVAPSQSASSLPFVPGISRATNGYLSRTLARRPKSALPGNSTTMNGQTLDGQTMNGTTAPLQLRPSTANNTTTTTNGYHNGQPTTDLTLGLGGVTGHVVCMKPKVPVFVTKEKQVLRFYAYFQEAVHEGGSMDTTGFRVRKFSIMYYLEDDTLSIEEPRQMNSGISQGKFMKRGQVSKPKALGGGSYKLHDFAIGAELWIYGRRFRIIDADESTRIFYGKDPTLSPLGSPESCPEDGYEDERAKQLARRQLQASGQPAREKGEYYKRDRRVLRFFCKYADDRLQGDRRDYVLYYYLLNDTVEIKEVAAEGRHNFPNLLRRQKLPRDSLHVPTGYGGVVSPRDPQKERVAVVTWNDLRCGEAINVYGRHLLLMSSDKATADWYAQRGIHQKTLTVGHEEVEALQMEKIAPYNGYGNEDDLFAMGLSLEPMNKEVNQGEYERFRKGDKKVLRFLAELDGVQGHDAEREFVVNYFLADDTLSVFEPPVRNSGVLGGLFLTRGKYKKYIPAVGQKKEGTRASDVLGDCGGLREAMVGLGGELSRWIRATDFIPGSIVTFEMPRSGSKLFTLKVTGYDEYTRKLLLQKDIFPQGASSLCMTRLAETFSAARLPVRSVMREQDSSGSGLLSARHFREILIQLEDEAEKAPCSVRSRSASICNMRSASNPNANNNNTSSMASVTSTPTTSTSQSASQLGLGLPFHGMVNGMAMMNGQPLGGGGGGGRRVPRDAPLVTRLSESEINLIISDFTDRDTRTHNNSSSSSNSHNGDGGDRMVLYDDFVDVLVVASPAALKLKERNRNLKVADRILKVMALAFEKEAAGGRLRALFRARERQRRQQDTHTHGQPMVDIDNGHIGGPNANGYGGGGGGGGKARHTHGDVDGHVQKSDWINVLRETSLNAIMTKQVAEALFLEHDTHGNGKLNFMALCDDVFAGDFDHFKYADAISSTAGSAREESEQDAMDDASGCRSVGPESDASVDLTMMNSSPNLHEAAPVKRAIAVPSLGLGLGSRNGSGSNNGSGNGSGLGLGLGGIRGGPVVSRGHLQMPTKPVKQMRYEKPPTVGSYLSKVNQELFTQHGDYSKQLVAAMRSFSSCFARANRKKMLRKHFLAFDVNNSGKISKEQFVETVDDGTAEFFVDFDNRYRDLLADFFFPKPHCRTDYETLLDIINVRDIRRAYAFHQLLMSEGSDYGELFTGVDDAARKRDFGGTLNLFEVR